MKSIKMLGLVAMAALLATAFVDASSTMAETTAFCNADENPCTKGKPTHVHETAVGKAKLLSSITIECDVLFLGDMLSALGSPLVIHGNLTYMNCGSCEIEEENGPGETKVLKEGHETTKVTYEYLVHMNCSGFINCSYNGVGLKGTGKGSLLSTEPNGEVSLKEQTTNKETGGFLCPTKTKLDITTIPLETIYISS